jgi:HAD superfamily hydrolase (TIGR01509 family)
LIKGLVFDFDGLILDTETVEYESLQWIYSQYGQTLSLDVWGDCIGTKHEFDPVVHLRDLAQLDTPVEELRRTYKARFCRQIREKGPMPGVVEYLQQGRELGLGLAVASSSPLSWVKGFLDELDLTSWFDAICTADDVDVVKPDPALYTTAAKRLGIKADEAIAFEDSPNGALAAKRAGLYCVVVPNSVTRSLAFGQYDLKLSSLAEMPLEQVIELVMARRDQLIS